jgi:GNAT superfamily N-acetyltransferase
MARKEDLPEVLEMIRELAVYERAPNEVTVTLEELENEGFGDRPMFEIVLAEVNGQVAGMAFYYPRYSTWKGRCMYLEDFIVKENMRGKGIGKALFDHVVKISLAFGAKRLEWQVLEWNEPAIRFYESVGAQLDGEWLNGRMTDEMLKKYRS